MDWTQPKSNALAAAAKFRLHEQGDLSLAEYKSKREICFSCGAKASHPKSGCPSKKAKFVKCSKERHYGSVCGSKRRDVRVNELPVHSATAPECVDCVLDEYEPVFFNAPIIAQDSNSGNSQSSKIRTSHPPIMAQPGIFITKSSRLTARLMPEQAATFCHCTRLKHSSGKT